MCQSHTAKRVCVCVSGSGAAPRFYVRPDSAFRKGHAEGPFGPQGAAAAPPSPAVPSGPFGTKAMWGRVLQL